MRPLLLPIDSFNSLTAEWMITFVASLSHWNRCVMCSSSRSYRSFSWSASLERIGSDRQSA